jgi:hypothetical protein
LITRAVQPKLKEVRMPILALAMAAAAVQGGSPSVYGPPAPPPPVYGPSIPTVRTVPDYGVPVSASVDRVLSDIDDGRNSGQLSRKQAKELRRELGEIGELERRFGRDGLSDDERAELQNRAAVVRAITNAKRIGAIK